MARLARVPGDAMLRIVGTIDVNLLAERVDVPDQCDKLARCIE
jgi:hypothetical protein